MPHTQRIRRARGLARRLLPACIAGTLCIAQAHADYPDKPVRLVVSYAPGNVADIVARITADALATQWKQSVVVDNRPGQGGSLGAQVVAKAPADGYTLLFSAMAAFGINPHVYPSVGYDAKKDFTPIVGIVYPNGLLVANVEVKANTFPELLALSRARPEGLYYGSAGSGTAPHLNMESLKARTGLNITHVPYKAATAVTTDLLGGRIQLQSESAAVLLPHVRAGKLKAIASMLKVRLPQLPALPSIVESVPGFEPVTPWMGLLAPAGTPREVVERIARDTAEFLRTPAGTERLSSQGMTVLGAGPAEFTRLVAGEYDRLGPLVKSLNLKVD